MVGFRRCVFWEVYERRPGRDVDIYGKSSLVPAKAEVYFRTLPPEAESGLTADNISNLTIPHTKRNLERH